MLSLAARADPADDIFRLEACPACDYSLARLPPEGRCPECGRWYDRRFIVLTGRGRGQYDTLAGGTWRGVASQLVAVAFIVWLASYHWRGVMDATVIIWVLLLAITVLVPVYARLFSSHDPRMQVWIGQQGMSQVASTPEARQAHWLLRNCGWLTTPLLVVLPIYSNDTARPGPVLSGVAAAVVLAGAAAGAVSYYRHRDQLIAANGEFAPPLRPWMEIDNVEVHPIGEGRVRFICRATRYWRGMEVSRHRAADLELQCSEAFAQQLKQRVLDHISNLGK